MDCNLNIMLHNLKLQSIKKIIGLDPTQKHGRHVIKHEQQTNIKPHKCYKYSLVTSCTDDNRIAMNSNSLLYLHTGYGHSYEAPSAVSL